MKATLYLVLGIILSEAGIARSQTWVQTSAPTNSWTSITASSDLSIIAASTSGGNIYVSTDSGTNWVATAPTTAWASVACSTNGSFMLAAANGGGIWTTTNYGLAWFQTSAPTNSWTGVTSSANAGTLIATATGGAWISQDFGITWQITGLPATNYQGNALYTAAASSLDGARLAIAQAGFGGGIWLSTNVGGSWTQMLVAAPLSAIASDGDGSVLGAIDYALFVSTNAGAGWTLPLKPGVQLNAVACSSLGSKILAIGNAMSFYLSANTGATWIAEPTPNSQLNAFAVSSDGNKVVAAASGGGIYTWQSTVPIIAGQPQTTTNLGTTTAFLSVGVFTSLPPQYQWMFDGNPIAGATTSSLVLTNVGLTNGGSYSVLVSNVNGSSLSSNAVLTIVPAFVTTLAANWGISDSFIGGSVTTGSNSTIAWFDWGATTNFGNETGPMTVPAGASGFAFTNHLTGLQPFTTYYYQAEASNSFGVATGAIASFTTAPRFVQTTGTNGGWTAFAWSADGSKILASQSGPLFFSTNQGASWMSTGGSGTLLAVSADGTSCFGINGTNSWFSTDQGASWITNGTPSEFSLLSCSANLEDVFASDGTYIYASTNAGMTWAKTSAPNGWTGDAAGGWVSLICSAGGSRVVAVRLVVDPLNRIETDDDFFTSSDGGTTWVNETYLENYYSKAIAASASGNTVYCSPTLASAMESVNAGSSWFYINAPAGNFAVTSLATSADASTLAEALQPYVYAYRAGIWTQANAPGPGPLLCSADGNELALLYNGSIYVAQLTSSPQLNAMMSSNGIVLSWTVPSSPATLQQSFDLRTWKPVTNSADLNNTNLQNQVTLPASRAQAFYRLEETNLVP